ncbi:serine--tRNA ligase [Ahrensia marina]|uniref:Serine--tRNA ligase n=1 Tax=Ahrensia marina TaxID=1514904 RepID=A0A0N1J6G0_9HYPH|nr:serine--tRNA ligase [Ahrensia marina]KPB01501.1 serine--tRNA ligase [Ahrensia marina]
MLDIRWIRENPEALDAGLGKRGVEPQSAALIALDEERRTHIAKVQEAQSRRNSASKEIGAAMGQGDTEKAEALKAEVGELKGFLQNAEDVERELNAKLNDALSVLPNIPLDDVPLGEDENDNVELRKVGGLPDFSFTPKEHFELGEALGMMDFETAAKLSGSRFTLLSGGLARLERALGQFMLDMHTGEHGYTEVNPPLMVRDEAMYGTGQLPKFTEDLYQTTEGHWLIPTAEVSLTNIVSGDIVDAETLPRRYTALTPCFRSEAGSAGRDTKGYLRQHQFYKVEMVSITDEDSSNAELDRMTKCAETVLEKLGLPFRTMVLCTGDMGFGARKTHDIEVWLPGQNTYREISSCSTCGDFQGRRMNARYRAKDEKQTKFVHSLNGSGVALGRALIAVMENYQNEDGSIRVPDVLKPYMGGLDVISA